MKTETTTATTATSAATRAAMGRTPEAWTAATSVRAWSVTVAKRVASESLTLICSDIDATTSPSTTP